MIKYGILFSNPCMKKLSGRVTISLLAALTTAVALTGLMGVEQAFAQETGGDAGARLLGAGLAFGLAAAGAGIGLGFVGAAGLAAISDNPKMQSRVFIFVGMVESIAIYGIVMMFIILGQ
jgi:V/A-type H+-transporting ATPase subunit K